jgi:hypothetical protein
MIEDEVCLPPQEEDECLIPDVLLHIAYEVVSQLDNAADFRQLSLGELSRQDFLVEQIDSLQLVVQAQVDHATPLAEDTRFKPHGLLSLMLLLLAVSLVPRRVLMGRLSSIAAVPLAVPRRSCFHLPGRGQRCHGMLCPTSSACCQSSRSLLW